MRPFRAHAPPLVRSAQKNITPESASFAYLRQLLRADYAPILFKTLKSRLTLAEGSTCREDVVNKDRIRSFCS
jgi:hypothetical protein